MRFVVLLFALHELLHRLKAYRDEATSERNVSRVSTTIACPLNSNEFRYVCDVFDLWEQAFYFFITARSIESSIAPNFDQIRALKE